MPRLYKRSYQRESCALMIFLSSFVLLTGFPNKVYGQSNDPSTRIETTLAQQLQTVLDDALVSQNLVGTLFTTDMTGPYLPAIALLFNVVFDFLQTTGVEEHVDTLPDNFELRQNYPNPFNPTTTITYQLSQAGQVTLQIYNVLGEEVRTLVNKNQPIGSYSMIWDGKDNLGRDVAGGVYFYQLSAKAEGRMIQQTRKLLLLR